MLEAQSSPLCSNTSLPRNSVQKDIMWPKEEVKIGEREATCAGKKKHQLVFQNSDPILPMKVTKAADQLPQALSPASLPSRTLGTIPKEEEADRSYRSWSPAWLQPSGLCGEGGLARITCSETPTFQGCLFP